MSIEVTDLLMIPHRDLTRLDAIVCASGRNGIDRAGYRGSALVPHLLRFRRLHVDFEYLRSARYSGTADSQAGQARNRSYGPSSRWSGPIAPSTASFLRRALRSGPAPPLQMPGRRESDPPTRHSCAAASAGVGETRGPKGRLMSAANSPYNVEPDIASDGSPSPALADARVGDYEVEDRCEVERHP